MARTTVSRPGTCVRTAPVTTRRVTPPVIGWNITPGTDAQPPAPVSREPSGGALHGVQEPPSQLLDVLMECTGPVGRRRRRLREASRPTPAGASEPCHGEAVTWPELLRRVREAERDLEEARRQVVSRLLSDTTTGVSVTGSAGT